MARGKYSKLAIAALCVGLVAGPRGAAAAEPGDVLRGYLAARWKGDVETARGLWDGQDLRRSQALGTSYTGLEARFDDNLLWSSEQRAAAAQAFRPVVRDSAVEAAWARYTVVLQPQAAGGRADTLQYWVRKSAGEWLLSSPFAKVTETWTMREGRYFRLYASKLRLVNRDNLRTLDEGMLGILDRLGTSELTRVRLERIKIEIYLCDTDAELRQLGVRPGESAYRLASERVVTRTLVDLNAASRALVHITLKEAPPRAPALLEEGLAAALGGWGGSSAEVTLQRGAALATRSPGDLESALDDGKRRAMQPERAASLAAIWCEALLGSLGSEKFLALYESLSGTGPGPIADATRLRGALETATGKRGAALVETVQNVAKTWQPPLAGGCTTVPEETRARQAVLRWRDPQEKWALQGFDEGAEYTFVLAPYEGATPKWAKQFMDSLGVKPDAQASAAPQGRPASDPPQVMILVRERITVEAEAYESPLFRQHFTRRPYAGELYGLLVSASGVRLYDYRRDVLVGVYDTDLAVPGAPAYFDEAAGRGCFRVRKDLLSKPLTDFMPMAVIYTGE